MDDKSFEIAGYVLNKGNEAHFILQRRLPPGSRLSFETAFKTVGKDSGETGQGFVSWLREKIFAGEEWGFYNEDGTPYTSTQSERVLPEPAVGVETKVAEPPAPQEDTYVEAKGAGKTLRRKKTSQVKKGMDISPSSIISADYTQAGDIIDACKDKTVLKKALNLSKHFANKEQHMRHILKRLEQV